MKIVDYHYPETFEVGEGGYVLEIFRLSCREMGHW